MSHNPKEAEREMEKAIFISADCWLKVFDFLSPFQLGLGIALISRRFDRRVDEHFKTRKWKLGEMEIRRKFGENGTNEMEIVNYFNWDSLPIPQNPLPNKVIGFRSISIDFFDQNVLTFLRRFHRFFSVCTTTSLYITTQNIRILEFAVLNIWPMLKDSIHKSVGIPSFFLKCVNWPRPSSAIIHHFALLRFMTQFCLHFHPTTVPMRRMAKRWPNGCSRLVPTICQRCSYAIRIQRWSSNGWQPWNKSKRLFPSLLFLLISSFMFTFHRPLLLLPLCHLN